MQACNRISSAWSISTTDLVFDLEVESDTFMLSSSYFSLSNSEGGILSSKFLKSASVTLLMEESPAATS